jgi:hypothetical protein
MRTMPTMLGVMWLGFPYFVATTKMLTNVAAVTQAVEPVVVAAAATVVIVAVAAATAAAAAAATGVDPHAFPIFFTTLLRKCGFFMPDTRP